MAQEQEKSQSKKKASLQKVATYGVYNFIKEQCNTFVFTS